MLSSYAWGLNSSLGVIWIEDHNFAGHMSVTNDAERVVEAVLKEAGVNWPILYKDSDHIWDELCHEDGKFTTFASCGFSASLQDAVEYRKNHC